MPSGSDPDTGKSEQVLAPIQRSPLYRVIYTNVIRPRITPYDFGFVVGAISETPGATAANLVVDEAFIVMSHAEMKFLTETLSKLLNAFEEEFGTINSPDLSAQTDAYIEGAIQGLITGGLKRARR